MSSELFDAGAVWHGPWHTGLVSGSFGSASNRHWAMALGKKNAPKNPSASVKAFLPFTSNRQRPKRSVLILEPGSLPFGRSDCKSFLLPIRLVVRKTDLEKRFKFEAFLPVETYQRAIQNYKRILEARKKHK